MSDQVCDSALGRPLRTADATGSAKRAGAKIHWESWGDGENAIYLVHGAAAHAGWWHGVAPRLAERGRVVAIDLSGHGASDHRSEYSVDCWALDLAAVVEATAPGPYEVVGHSLGGVVAALACSQGYCAPGQLVLVDSRSRDQTQPWPPRRGGRAYPTREAAIAAFRLLPPQPVVNEPYFDYLAAISVRELDGAGRWGWRFDPEILAPRPIVDLSTCVGRLDIPVPLIRGELSALVTPSYVEGIAAGRPNVGPILEIPEAYHHVMIDRPAETAAAVALALDG
jgi:pimeloyl-ACP methyl ester carboxylesterase